MKLIAAALLSMALAGCSWFPPLTLSGGFMGATVSVSTPGWSAPVPVVAVSQITKPTLLVPKGSIASRDQTAVVAATAQTAKMSVPVVVAPVKSATLAVPVTSKLSPVTKSTLTKE
jgi:hypothetical protein